MLDENLLREPADRGIRLVALSLLDRARAADATLLAASHDLREGRARSDDALHDFRVAVRRLRSWIRAFKPWLREDVSRKKRRRLSAIADATSAIRDATVHLEWLRHERRTLTAPQRAGHRWLGKRLKAERSDAADAALDAAKDFAEMADKLTRRLNHYCSAILADEAGPRFGAVLAERVLEEGEALRACLAVIEGAHDVEAAHRARIAAKRLRYVAEPVSSLAGGDTIVEELKSLQDALGNLHDVHVFSKELAAASEENESHAMQRARSRDPGPGLAHLARRLHKRGAHAYADVESHWLNGAGAPFFNRLRGFADDIARCAENGPA